MSLLDQGTHTVMVYPAVQTTDSDGNPVSVAGPGYAHRASIQPLSATESNELGVGTTEVYRLRFAKPEPVIGPASQIGWLNTQWSIVGYPRRHTGSTNTEHLVYHIKRS